MDDSSNTMTQITDLEAVVIKVLLDKRITENYDAAQRRTENFTTSVRELVEENFHRVKDRYSHEEMVDLLGANHAALSKLDLSAPTEFTSTPAYYDLAVMMDEVLQHFIVSLEKPYKFNSPSYHVKYIEDGTVVIHYKDKNTDIVPDAKTLKKIQVGFTDAYGMLESYISAQGNAVGLNPWMHLGPNPSPAKQIVLKHLKEFFSTMAQPYVTGEKKPRYRVRGDLDEEQLAFRDLIKEFTTGIQEDFNKLPRMPDSKDALWKYVVEAIVVPQVLDKLPEKLVEAGPSQETLEPEAGIISGVSSPNQYNMPTMGGDGGVHIDTSFRQAAQAHEQGRPDTGTKVFDFAGGELVDKGDNDLSDIEYNDTDEPESGQAQQAPVSRDAETLILTGDEEAAEQADEKKYQRTSTLPGTGGKQLLKPAQRTPGGTLFGMPRDAAAIASGRSSMVIHTKADESASSEQPQQPEPDQQPQEPKARPRRQERPASKNTLETLAQMGVAEPETRRAVEEGEAVGSQGYYSVQNPESPERKIEEKLSDVLSTLGNLERVKLKRYELDERERALEKLIIMFRDPNFVFDRLNALYSELYSVDTGNMLSALRRFGNRIPTTEEYDKLSDDDQQAVFEASGLYPNLLIEDKVVVDTEHTIAHAESLGREQAIHNIAMHIGEFLVYDYQLKGLPGAEEMVADYVNRIQSGHLPQHLMLNEFFNRPEDLAVWLKSTPATVMSWSREEIEKTEASIGKRLEDDLRELDELKPKEYILPKLLRNRYLLRHSLILDISDVQTGRVDRQKLDDAVMDMQNIVGSLEAYAAAFKIEPRSIKVGDECIEEDGFEELMDQGRQSPYFNELDLSNKFLIEAMRIIDAYPDARTNSRTSKKSRNSMAVHFATLLANYVSFGIQDQERRERWHWNVYKDVSDLLAIRADYKGEEFSSHQDIPDLLEKYVTVSLNKRIELLQRLVKAKPEVQQPKPGLPEPDFEPSAEAYPEATDGAVEQATPDEALAEAEGLLDGLLGLNGAEAAAGTQSNQKQIDPVAAGSESKKRDTGAIEIPVQHTGFDDKLGGVPDGSGLHDIRRVKDEAAEKIADHETEQGHETNEDLERKLSDMETIAGLLPIHAAEKGAYTKEELSTFNQFQGIEDQVWDELTNNMKSSPYFAILQNNDPDDALRLQLTEIVDLPLQDSLLAISEVIADYVFVYANNVGRTITSPGYSQDNLSRDLGEQLVKYLGQENQFTFEMLTTALTNYKAQCDSTAAGLKSTLQVQPATPEELAAQAANDELEPEIEFLDDEDYIEEPDEPELTEEQKMQNSIEDLEQLIADAQRIKGALPQTQHILSSGFDFDSEPNIDDELAAANDLQHYGRDEENQGKGTYDKLIMPTNKMYADVIFQATEYVTNQDHIQVAWGIVEALSDRILGDSKVEREEGDLSPTFVRDKLYDKLIMHVVPKQKDPTVSEEEVVEGIVSILDHFDSDLETYVRTKQDELKKLEDELKPDEPEEPEPATQTAPKEYDLAGLIIDWIPSKSDVTALETKETDKWHDYKALLLQAEAQLPEGKEKMSEAFAGIGLLVSDYINELNQNTNIGSGEPLPEKDAAYIADTVEEYINRLWVGAYVALENASEEDDALSQVRQRFNYDAIDTAIRQFKAMVEEKAIADGTLKPTSDSMVENYADGSAEEPAETLDLDLDEDSAVFDVENLDGAPDTQPMEMPPLPADGVGRVKSGPGRVTTTVHGPGGPISPHGATIPDDGRVQSSDVHEAVNSGTYERPAERPLSPDEERVSGILIKYLHVKYVERKIIKGGDTPQVQAQLEVDVQRVFSQLPENPVERRAITSQALEGYSKRHKGIGDFVQQMQGQHGLSQTDAQACAVAYCSVIDNYEASGKLDPERVKSLLTKVQRMKEEQTPQPADASSPAGSPLPTGPLGTMLGPNAGPPAPVPSGKAAGLPGMPMAPPAPVPQTAAKAAGSSAQAAPTKDGSAVPSREEVLQGIPMEDHIGDLLYLCKTMEKSGKKRTKAEWTTAMDQFFKGQGRGKEYTVQNFYGVANNTNGPKDLAIIMLDAYNESRRIDQELALQRKDQEIGELKGSLAEQGTAYDNLATRVAGVEEKAEKTTEAVERLGQDVQSVADNVHVLAEHQAETTKTIDEMSNAMFEAAKGMAESRQRYDDAVVIAKKEPEPEKSNKGLIGGILGVTALVALAALVTGYQRDCNGCDNTSKQRNNNYIPSQPETGMSQPGTKPLPGTTPGMDYGMTPMSPMDAMKAGYMNPSPVHGMVGGMAKPNPKPMPAGMDKGMSQDPMKPNYGMQPMGNPMAVMGVRKSGMRGNNSGRRRRRRRRTMNAPRPRDSYKGGIEVRNVDPSKLTR